MTLVRLEAHDAVALVTIDHPKVNALSADVIEDLVAAIGSAADPAFRAVVVTGSPHFAAGADITAFKGAMAGAGMPADLGVRLSEACNLIEGLAKPVIAAVHGFALGGGLELALACDFRFLAGDARVGQPEVKLGLIPGAGGTQRLPRLVGIARGRDMVYSGRMVDASEAMAIGLADLVLPSHRLLDTSMEAAAAWATGPTRAIGIAKKVMNLGFDLPLRDALDLESKGFAEVFSTKDAVEGIDAFLEKRETRFIGE